MAVKALGPKSRAGLMANDVSIPRDAPMPKMLMKSTRGTSPFGGGPFFLSVMANNTTSKTADAMNSEKKHETDVIYGNWNAVSKSVV
jgi:hypothetical protein